MPVISFLARFFVVKTRIEAWVLIYAIASGAVSRGVAYLSEFPGAGGWALFLASTVVVFIAGPVILDYVSERQRLGAQSSSSQSSAA